MQTYKPSKWWYLFPGFLGILGGLIAFVILKGEDRQMAKDAVFIGVISSGCYLGLAWALVIALAKPL